MCFVELNKSADSDTDSVLRHYLEPFQAALIIGGVQVFHYRVSCNGKLWVPEVERGSPVLTYPQGSCMLLFRPLTHCQNCPVSEPQSAFHSFSSAKKKRKPQQREDLKRPARSVTADLTHFGDPFFAPLADTLADAHDAFYSSVESLLHVLQGRHHGDVGDGKGHAGPEDGLLTAALATIGRIALS